MMTPNTTHRQNVCDRYDLELKDALAGLQLQVSMAAYEGSYFNYDPETGIDSDYPGLTAIILDELSRRGKFTWRDSFGLTGNPADVNATWKDLLLWSIDSYDMQIDWWAINLDRMNIGVAFMKEWYDSSIILIAREAPEEISDEIIWFNWLRPYEPEVWLLTIFTIFLSGIVYQILEWYADDRQDRTMWQWWQENFYLSAINFTQAYEYQPKTFASRMFGVSMALWALVMTATYTANLASLLVDRKTPPVVAQSMDEVSVFGNTICTWEGTWSDDYIRETHPGATRIPKKTVLEMYQGLYNGECDFAADAVASWNKNVALKEYNPYCNLYWVGGDRKAAEMYAGFVSKVDSGRLCTGFIRDVINLHMHDMIEDGFLSHAWDREYKRTADINCDTYRPELASAIEQQINGGDNSTEGNEATRRNLLRSNVGRQLKAGGKGAAGGAVAAAAGGGGDAQKLTVEQMFGTFAFHWCVMAIALFLANVNALHRRYLENKAKEVAHKVVDPLVESFHEAVAVPSKRVLQKMDKSVYNLVGNSTRRNTNKSNKEEDRDTSTRRTTVKSEEDDESDGYLSLQKDSLHQEQEAQDQDLQLQLNDMFRSEKPQEQDLRKQMNAMRQSQTQMRQSQSQMEKYQMQMQQAQLQMLQEQRNLQAQIQALLADQGSRGPKKTAVAFAEAHCARYDCAEA